MASKQSSNKVVQSWLDKNKIAKVFRIFDARDHIEAAHTEIERLEAELAKHGKTTGSILPSLASNHAQEISKLKSVHAQIISSLKTEHETAIAALQMQNVDDVSVWSEKVKQAEQSANRKASNLMATLGIPMDDIQVNFQPLENKGITIVSHNR